jgi:hypothetical protein
MVQVTFLGHLTTLKAKIFHPKSISISGSLVFGLLNSTLLDQQTSFFAITMKSSFHGALHPLHDFNPTTKLWG